MNIKNALNRAAVYYKNNDFEESIAICKKILDKKSTIYEAMYLLALNYQGSANYQESIKCFEALISRGEDNADVLNALANTYICIKDFVKSKKYCVAALRKEPNFAEAHNNLAICEQSLGQAELAEKHYKKAMLLQGNTVVFRLNLAKLYKELGDFEKSNDVLVGLMEYDGDKSSVYFSLYENYMYLHQYENALQIADIGLVSQELKDIDLIELLVGKAILFWLFDNVDEAEQAIRLSESVYSYPQGSYENLDNLKVFHAYLKKLIMFYRQNNDLYKERKQDIYFISESHGFAPNNMQVVFAGQALNVRSLFIKGAKVFHFTQPNNNKFKASLAHLLDGLPSGSPLVFGFGEIDCRYNEGVLKYCLEHNKDYVDVIDNMLEKYIDLLIQESIPKGFVITIYGVPAPHPDQLKYLTLENQVLLKNIILHFNNVLSSLCNKHQLNFLDVYKLTNIDGESNLEYHLDDIHVHPLVVPQLFEQKITDKCC